MKSILTFILLFPLLIYGQKMPDIFKSVSELKSFSEIFSNTPKDSSIILGDSLFWTTDQNKLTSNYRDNLYRNDSSMLSLVKDSGYILKINIIGKIKCSKELIGIVIGFFIHDCQHRDITFLYLYSNANPAFFQEIKLQNDWACEGGEGFSESWILDYNNDGKADILCKDYSFDSGGDVFRILNETYNLYINESGCFKKLNNIDLVSLKKKFKIKEREF
jgi:hypothetical protein